MQVRSKQEEIKREEFRRLPGVKQETFAAMLLIIEEALKNSKNILKKDIKKQILTQKLLRSAEKFARKCRLFLQSLQKYFNTKRIF